MPLNSLYEKLLFSLRSFSREKRADRKRKKRELCFGACGEWAGERKLLSFINQPGAEEMLGIGRRRGRFGFVRPGAVSSSSSSSSFPEMRKRQRGKERRGGGEKKPQKNGERSLDGWMDGYCGIEASYSSSIRISFNTERRTFRTAFGDGHPSMVLPLFFRCFVELLAHRDFVLRRNM